MGYQLVVADLTSDNLCNIAQLVSQYPPFSQYGFKAMLTTLETQLQRKSNVCVHKDGLLVGYAGWLFTNHRVIEQWMKGESNPLPDWDNPQAALVNIFVSSERRAIPKLVRGISDCCAGVPIYRKRTFQGDRTNHKRPAIKGRQQFNQKLEQKVADQAEQSLANLLVDVYQRAQRKPMSKPFPITFIDCPDTAAQIFRKHEVFEKNYAFLDDFAGGRFSANGESWAKRQILTQPLYSKAPDLKQPDVVFDTYCRHLTASPIRSTQALYNRFLSAATEVVQRAFGIHEPLGWSPENANRVLQMLQVRQAISWNPALQSVLPVSVNELKQAYKTIRQQFYQSAQGNAFLQGLANQMGEDTAFDPAEELVQNFLAATETTASSLAWSVELLSKKPDLQQQLRESDNPESPEFKGFINEMLRLYPPVPIVTRKANRDIELNDTRFSKDEHMLISIVGLHTHPDYWQKPLEFNPQRPELMHERYDRKAFLPFLTGARSCGGRRLGQMEIEQGIRALLHCFELRAEPGPSRFRYVTTLRPVLSPALTLNPLLVNA